MRGTCKNCMGASSCKRQLLQNKDRQGSRCIFSVALPCVSVKLTKKKVNSKRPCRKPSGWHLVEGPLARSQLACRDLSATGPLPSMQCGGLWTGLSLQLVMREGWRFGPFCIVDAPDHVFLWKPHWKYMWNQLRVGSQLLLSNWLSFEKCLGSPDQQLITAYKWFHSPLLSSRFCCSCKGGCLTQDFFENRSPQLPVQRPPREIPPSKSPWLFRKNHEFVIAGSEAVVNWWFSVETVKSILRKTLMKLSGLVGEKPRIGSININQQPTTWIRSCRRP